MKLLIIIPVYITNDLHLEFTQKTIESIKTKHQYEILIVNNHCELEFLDALKKLGTVIDNPKGNILAAAWNYGASYVEKHVFDYIVYPNNDIIFHSQCIDNLVDFAEKHTEYVIWSAGQCSDMRTIEQEPLNDLFDEHPCFSLFMVKSNFYSLLREKEFGTKEPQPGLFDENFKPAYFEDGDMHQRVLRQGLKASKTTLALFYHFGSRTIKVDDELNVMNRVTYETNRNYFKSKWGFDPHNSVLANDAKERFLYKQPFDIKEEHEEKD